MAEEIGRTLSCQPDDTPFLLLRPLRIMTLEAHYG